jgi:diguanylate cyclase (GGDEF)-like protein
MTAAADVTMEQILGTLPGFVYHCRGDQQRTFDTIGPGFQDCTGYTPEEAATNPELQHAGLIHAEDRPGIDASIQESIARRQPYELRYRIVRPDRSLRSVSDRGSPRFAADGGLLGLAGFITPSSEHRGTSSDAIGEDRLPQFAREDLLTGLPNRQAALEWLAQARREGRPESLLILNLDIDNFQWINNTFGREQADHVIQVMAQELRHLIKPDDLLARLQSDEFLLMIRQTEPGQTDAARTADDTAHTETVLQKLRIDFNSRLEERHDIPYIPGYCIGCRHVHGGPRQTSAESPAASSSGPAAEPSTADAEALLLEANTALSEAKRSGVNRQSVFIPEMSRIIQRRIQLESRLSMAQQLEEFRLHYQPIVRRDGLIVGAEALMRWPQTDGSFIPPYLFIPLLEKNGRIREVGRWLIATACEQLARWRADGLKLDYLSINVSAAQLLSKELPMHALLLDTISRHQLEPSSILLEITETAVLENMELARLELERLTSLGFGIALDDFGTGYSSLLTLLQLPISALKIDKSFVDGIADQPKSIALVETCISIADKLGLRCIAEGVEAELQCQSLRKIGCQYFQGYLYDQALPPQELALRLRGQQTFRI